MNEVLNQYIEATNTHDFSEVAKCLNKNAVYYFSNKTCVGMDEVKNYFENSWNIVKDEKYWATDVKLLSETDDTIVCIYQYNYSGYINDKYAEGHGRATNVFIRNKSTNRWELVHEHLSATPKS
jgi:ketosteroid isomerase-like protein